MELGTGWTLIPSTAGLSLELAFIDAPAVAVWLPFDEATTTGSSDAESPERWSTTPLSTDSVLLFTLRPFAMDGPAVIDAINSARIFTCLLFNICSPNSDGRNTQEVTATVLLVLFTLFTKLSLIRKSAQIVYNPHEAGDEI
nr:hypothetical protein [Providencia heimbachae]